MSRTLLRLVHSIERRARGVPFRAVVTLTDDTGRVVVQRTVEDAGPTSIVVGTGDRVDVAGPEILLPRQLAIIFVPSGDSVAVRVVSLHAERAFLTTVDDIDQAAAGGVEAHGEVTVRFDGLRLDVEAFPLTGARAQVDGNFVHTQAPGEQLAFHNHQKERLVGNVVSSIGGPVGGGHAVPALVAVDPEPLSAGSLVLRARDAVHKIEPSFSDLTRGVLIGRSRRCVLGRGFDENDGLSRVHALVVMLYDGVWVFDLASRYGLRDVARPTRVLRAARLDNGTGCLVYGAGHLVFEP